MKVANSNIKLLIGLGVGAIIYFFFIYFFTPNSAPTECPIPEEQSVSFPSSKTTNVPDVPNRILEEIHLSRLQTNRLNQEGMSKLEIWNSPLCQTFYHPLVHRFSAESLNRYAECKWCHPLNTNDLPILVLEDFHPGGRRFSIGAMAGAQEVHLVPEYNIAYITIRKCASLSIRSFLESIGGKWSGWCPQWCQIYGNRCSTLCITREHIKRYTFFTFVCDPIERFWKAYTTYYEGRGLPKRKAELRMSQSEMMMILDEIGKHGFVADHHFQTQSFALSSPLRDSDGPPKPIPIGFIGSAETFSESWKELQGLVRSKYGKNLPSNTHRDRHRIIWSDEEKLVLKKKMFTPMVRKRVQEVYAQDIVCLGY